MKPIRKENRQFYFTVEGDTEKLYLDWLKRLINATPESRYSVTIKCEVQKDPSKYAKRFVSPFKSNITHWFDYESDDSEHVKLFRRTLDSLADANKTHAKKLHYLLGYSNLTFELWMALHKKECSYKAHRDHYIEDINKAFGERFAELKTFKEHRNFERALEKLTLEDVKTAIERAKQIMKRNQNNGLRLEKYRGFDYYKDNPSLTIHESVEEILKVCKLI